MILIQNLNKFLILLREMNILFYLKDPIYSKDATSAGFEPAQVALSDF